MNISEKSVYQILLALGDDGLTVKELLLALNQRELIGLSVGAICLGYVVTRYIGIWRFRA